MDSLSDEISLVLGDLGKVLQMSISISQSGGEDGFCLSSSSIESRSNLQTPITNCVITLISRVTEISLKVNRIKGKLDRREEGVVSCMGQMKRVIKLQQRKILDLTSKPITNVCSTNTDPVFPTSSEYDKLKNENLMLQKYVGRLKSVNEEQGRAISTLHAKLHQSNCLLSAQQIMINSHTSNSSGGKRYRERTNADGRFSWGFQDNNGSTNTVHSRASQPESNSTRIDVDYEKEDEDFDASYKQPYDAKVADRMNKPADISQPRGLRYVDAEHPVDHEEEPTFNLQPDYAMEQEMRQNDLNDLLRGPTQDIDFDYCGSITSTAAGGENGNISSRVNDGSSMNIDYTMQSSEFDGVCVVERKSTSSGELEQQISTERSKEQEGSNDDNVTSRSSSNLSQSWSNLSNVEDSFALVKNFYDQGMSHE